MSIIRTKHDRQNPYVMINRSSLWDDNLSLEAIGLWARLLSRPDDWTIHADELARKCKLNPRTIHKYLNELIDHGYCFRMQARVEGRRQGVFADVEYVVFETKQTPEELKLFFPSVTFPSDGNVTCGNDEISREIPRSHIYTLTKEELYKEKENKEKEDPPDVGVEPGGSQIFSSSEKIKKKEKKPPKPTSPESKRLSKIIWEHVSGLYPDAKPPKLSLIWERQLDKLHLEDNRSWLEIEEMIHFMAAHEFWKSKLCGPGDLARLWTKIAIQKRQQANSPAVRESSNSRLALSFSDYLESVDVEVARTHIGLKNGIHYVPVNYNDPDFQVKLRSHLTRRGADVSRIFPHAS